MENDLVVVAIHDQGIGLKREQIPKIFEPFCTTKSSAANWGIGLSYCYLVVESLGGDLFVESVPGKGSSFFVVLPLPAG
ncbi:MAG: ATP-binding protein [Bacillota bacterium]